jgi:hypothetical protein
MLSYFDQILPLNFIYIYVILSTFKFEISCQKINSSITFVVVFIYIK